MRVNLLISIFFYRGYDKIQETRKINNMFKRIYRSIFNRLRQTSLLLVVMFVISLLLCVTFSIKNVSDVLNNKIAASVNPVVSINASNSVFSYLSDYDLLRKIGYQEYCEMYYEDYYQLIDELKPQYYDLNMTITNQSLVSYSDEGLLYNVADSELLSKIKRNKVVKETPNFIMNKAILNCINANVLTNEIIQFISIFFDINIFVIDNFKNCVIFYSLSQYFNKFKHNIILIKTTHIDAINGSGQVDYYKNVYYDNQTQPLLDELFNNYPKMIMYSQLANTVIEPTLDNINYIILKHTLDDDLNIISNDLKKNKNQQDLKEKKKIERKMKPKVKKEEDLTETEEMMNELMETPTELSMEFLSAKNYKELRQIAKSHKIKLSYVDRETNERKHKTRKELIDALIALIEKA